MDQEPQKVEDYYITITIIIIIYNMKILLFKMTTTRVMPVAVALAVSCLEYTWIYKPICLL